MKKLLFTAFLGILLSVSVKANISITTDTLKASYSMSTHTIGVLTSGCSSGWSLISKPSWINLNVNAGVGNINFEVSYNNQYIKRTGQIILSNSCAGGFLKTDTLTVVQETEYIDATIPKLETYTNISPIYHKLSSSEQVIEIEAQSNTGWDLYLPTDPEIVDAYCQPCSGYGDSTIKVKININKLNTSRSFKIYLKLQSNPNIVKEITIVQSPFIVHNSHNKTIQISTENNWYIQNNCQTFYTLSDVSGSKSDTIIHYEYYSYLDSAVYANYKDTLIISDGFYTERIPIEKIIQQRIMQGYEGDNDIIAFWGNDSNESGVYIWGESSVLTVSKNSSSSVLTLFVIFNDNKAIYKIKTDDSWISFSSINGIFPKYTLKTDKQINVSFSATNIERVGKIIIEWFALDHDDNENLIGESILYVCQNPTDNSIITHIFDSNVNIDAIQAYPNPFSDVINIKSPYTINHVIVRDINGNNQSFNISGSEIQLNPTMKGLLFLEIHTNNGIFTQKVIQK